MSKRVRWVCPNGCAGVLGPTRMNAMDPRRFCLKCSGKPGVSRLVARTAPVLERVRATRFTRRRAKTDKAKAKLNALPWEKRNDLIQREFKRLLKLRCWRDRVKGSTLKIRRSKSASRDVSGHAKTWSREIVLTIHTRADRAWICAGPCRDPRLAWRQIPQRSSGGDARGVWNSADEIVRPAVEARRPPR